MIEQKPTFNVTEPFDGVTILQMNDGMRNLLHSFIFDEDQETTPVEVYALGEALNDPRQWHRKASETSFSTERFEGVTTVHLNRSMIKILRSFINEYEDLERELVALNRALGNPEQCYRLRQARRATSRQEQIN